MPLPKEDGRKPINLFLIFNLYTAKGYQNKVTALINFGSF